MSESLALDMTPTIEYLQAEHNSNLGWKKAVPELVDNAFDADAARVDIVFKGHDFTISDDGSGAKDIRAMLRLGDHRKSRAATLGRYGVGLKKAAIWAWGETTIATNRGGSVSWVHVNWPALRSWELNSERDHVSPELCRRFGLADEHGTSIRFHNTKRRAPALKDIVQWLSYQFSPAISQGRQIRVKVAGKQAVVPELQHPPLEFLIEKELEVNGKKCRVRAGIVPVGHKNPLAGFTYCHRHRVLCTDTNGCGAFSVERFFGWVELLGDEWSLGVTKDCITEDDEPLYQALESCCGEQLRRAHSESSQVELSGLEQNISSALTNALCEQHKKARRDSTREKHGTVKPADTGRVHKRAAKLQSSTNRTILGPCAEGGAGSIRRVGNSILVHFSDSDNDGRIGLVQVNDKVVSVTLYLQHPAVQWAKQDHSENALAVLSASLIAMYAVSTDNSVVKQKLLPFIVEGEDARESLFKALAAYTQCVRPAQEAAV